MSSRPSSFTLSSHGPMRLYSTTELLALPSPEWLVDTMLPSGGLCCIYGPSGIGKSFLTMDVALSVASGRPWLGKDVRKGYVVYVAAEGGPGIAKRARSWCVAHDVAPASLGIAWLVEPMNVYTGSADVEALMGRLDDEILERPRLIVVDTLARCLEGDENAQEDMGRFVAGLDALRHEYGSTILVVHHTRLDGERERGSSAFRGGTDTMISVKRRGEGQPMTLECTKQKDDEAFPDVVTRLTPVEGTKSCIVELNSPVERMSRAVDTVILDTLTQQGELSYSALWLEVKAHGASPATFKRWLVSLRESGEIVRENGIYAMA